MPFPLFQSRLSAAPRDPIRNIQILAGQDAGEEYNEDDDLDEMYAQVSVFSTNYSIVFYTCKEFGTGSGNTAKDNDIYYAGTFCIRVSAPFCPWLAYHLTPGLEKPPSETRSDVQQALRPNHRFFPRQAAERRVLFRKYMESSSIPSPKKAFDRCLLPCGVGRNSCL